MRSNVLVYGPNLLLKSEFSVLSFCLEIRTFVIYYEHCQL